MRKPRTFARSLAGTALLFLPLLLTLGAGEQGTDDLPWTGISAQAAAGEDDLPWT
ncbi:hypothetical protein [Streptomyces sp. SCL15-6]|jgi:hypothetical protein|uniref:hypothetical protein n=1 Tax=Streptomyces sp. SCL15-6 TaxID=2967222 RepID=UPI0029662F82|nr:hypothetical protein [Streptomyces sp. SCL15-6]